MAKALLYLAKMQWALDELEEPDSPEWELTPGHGRSMEQWLRLSSQTLGLTLKNLQDLAEHFF